MELALKKELEAQRVIAHRQYIEAAKRASQLALLAQKLNCQKNPYAQEVKKQADLATLELIRTKNLC